MFAPTAQEQKIISLQRLYDFVREHQRDKEALRLDNRSPSAAGYKYCRECENITECIDEAQGFYLWGHYDQKGYWHSVYLGKAGFGKTKNLRMRIREELKDERCCIWRSVFTLRKLHAIRNRIHDGQYERSWNRSMLKAGTTHIIWVPVPGVAKGKINSY